MHLIDKDTAPKKDSLGTAIKKKIRSAAGAPGRAAFRVYDKAINEPKRKESDYEYKTLKTYNDYKKNGRPFVESKPNAQGATGDQRMIAEFHRVKDKLSK